MKKIKVCISIDVVLSFEGGEFKYNNVTGVLTLFSGDEIHSIFTSFIYVLIEK